MNRNLYVYALTVTLAVLAAVMLVGCGPRYITVEQASIPANLTQPCPDLERLEAGDGKTIIKWTLGTIGLYKDCQDKHMELVNATKPKE